MTGDPARRGRLTASPDARAAQQRLERARLEKIAAELIEQQRLRDPKLTAAGRRRMGEVVIREKERSPDTGEIVVTTRACRKYLTTLDQLEKRGQLDKHLRVAFDKVAEAVALSSGACTSEDDLHGSSSRGISRADGGGVPQFGSRTFSDQMLRAERLRQYALGMIPEDMMRLANQLIMEETGMTLERPTSLAEYGNANGFNQEQQARSSGATMAIDLCRIVHHALKSREA